MASAVTHIILADKIFKGEFSSRSRDQFMVGTSFPDIRYLRVIEREKTHFVEPTLEAMKNETDCRAGMMFHSLVDQWREAFLERQGIYELVPQSRFITQALKLLEDELLYDKISDWSQIAAYFDIVCPEELEYPIVQQDIQKWHALIRDYISQRPNTARREAFFRAIYFQDAQIQEIEKAIALIRTNQKVVEILESLYTAFETPIH